MSVSRLVRRMKNILEIEIGDVWVEGEVSNLRKQGSGHFISQSRMIRPSWRVRPSMPRGGAPVTGHYGMGHASGFSGR